MRGKNVYQCGKESMGSLCEAAIGQIKCFEVVILGIKYNFSSK